jgi:hypothetical protein
MRLGLPSRAYFRESLAPDEKSLDEKRHDSP